MYTMYYGLYSLLKEGNQQEFKSELNKLYDEKLQKYESYKLELQKCDSRSAEISETIFEKEPYCLNPEEPWFRRITTRLKITPQNIELYDEYKNCESQTRKYLDWLMKLQHELQEIASILEDYKIYKDKEKIRHIFG